MHEFDILYGFTALLRFRYMNENETIGTTDLRQSLAGGVPKGKWYVAVVKSNYEAMTRDYLKEMGYEAYVASQKRLHHYKNRHHREVEKIVITRTVFVRIANERERLDVLKNCQLIQHFMMDRASTPNKYGRSPFAIIPDYQMDALQYMLYHSETDVEFVAAPFAVGDKVKVMRGGLQGVEGEVVILNDGNKQGVGIRAGFLGFAIVTVDAEDIERI